MTQCLQPLFSIETDACGRCGGYMRVIACIDDQDIMPDKVGQALDRILAQLCDKDILTLSLRVTDELFATEKDSPTEPGLTIYSQHTVNPPYTHIL